jgi:hypothetical protein
MLNICTLARSTRRAPSGRSCGCFRGTYHDAGVAYRHALEKLLVAQKQSAATSSGVVVDYLLFWLNDFFFSWSQGSRAENASCATQ